LCKEKKTTFSHHNFDSTASGLF